MHFMLFAFAVIWTLVCYFVFRIVHRFCPDRFDDPKLMMVAFVIVGALVTIATFTGWAVYPH